MSHPPTPSSTNAVPEDTYCAPLRLSAPSAASMHTAVEQQQVLLAVGERLLQQSAMILHETTCHSVAMTLLTPVMATGKLRLLYAALGPAAAHSNGLVTHWPEAGSPHVGCFESGETALDGAVAPPSLLLPVFGHDGRVCCVLQYDGVQCSAAVPPAVVRHLRAAAGHSGLLELLTEGFAHPPCVLQLALEAMAVQVASMARSSEALGKAAARRWVPDEEAAECSACAQPFNLLRRRHHCRECLQVVCSACSPEEHAKVEGAAGEATPRRWRLLGRSPGQRPLPRRCVKCQGREPPPQTTEAPRPSCAPPVTSEPPQLAMRLGAATPLTTALALTSPGFTSPVTYPYLCLGDAAAPAPAASAAAAFAAPAASSASSAPPPPSARPKRIGPSSPPAPP